MKVIILLFICLLSKSNGKCAYDSRKEAVICTQTNLQEINNFLPEFQKSIETLTVSNSTISRLPINAFPHVNLQKIEIHSKISDLNGGAFGNIQNLQTLNLSGNEISQISAGNHGLNHLNALDLSDNRIQRLTPDALHDLTRLTELSLARNQIEELPTQLFNFTNNLRRLDLSGNRIRVLQPGIFAGSTEIQTLDISRNKITEIQRRTFNGLNNLKILNISYNLLGNKLDGVPSTCLDLNLSHNNITTLHNLNKIVQSITFHNSRIKQHKINTVKTLNVSHNNIDRVGNSVWNNLEVVDVSYNALRTLEAKMFNGANLKEVIANNNEIFVLRTKTFTQKNHLECIDVGNNRLAYVELEFFRPIPHVKRFNIAGNPWDCACLSDLVTHLNKRNITFDSSRLFDGSKPSCVVTDNKVCRYEFIDRSEFDEAF